jgi:hypothetical protein
MKIFAEFSRWIASNCRSNGASLWDGMSGVKSVQNATSQFTTGRTRICVIPEENSDPNRT